MPPRKSDLSKAGTGDEETPAKDGKDSKELPIREGTNIEDLNLPKSIVTRLAKGVLPPNTQIQANAMVAMTKSATVFINYLASHANENAQAQNHKTINPPDVFKALYDLEFPDFIPRLEAELAKFTEIATFKRNQYRAKVAADKAAGKAVEEDLEDEDPLAEGEERVDKDGQPAAKKARLNPSDDMGGEPIHERLQDTEHMEHDKNDADEEEEKHGDETEDEDDHEERLDVEEPLEERDEPEVEDEALDNGDDSD